MNVRLEERSHLRIFLGKKFVFAFSCMKKHFFHKNARDIHILNVRRDRQKINDNENKNKNDTFCILPLNNRSVLECHHVIGMFTIFALPGVPLI